MDHIFIDFHRPIDTMDDLREFIQAATNAGVNLNWHDSLAKLSQEEQTRVDTMMEQAFNVVDAPEQFVDMIDEIWDQR